MKDKFILGMPCITLLFGFSISAQQANCDAEGYKGPNVRDVSTGAGCGNVHYTDSLKSQHECMHSCPFSLSYTFQKTDITTPENLDGCRRHEYRNL